MDSAPSPFSRAERTFWTVWTYITEVVGRYLRPEPNHTDDSRPEQEATAARQTDDNGDEENKEIKSTEVSPESVSDIKPLRHAVTWEKGNVQYTGTASKGNDYELSHEVEELKYEIHKSTTQNDTKEEFNGQEVQFEIFTDKQIKFKETSSESSKVQAGDGYNSTEEKLSTGTVAKRKQEEKEFPVDSKEFHFSDDVNQTEDQRDNTEEKTHFGTASTNLPSICAEPVKLMESEVNAENMDIDIIQDAQSTEEETTGRLNETGGEEGTTVSFMDSEEERLKEEVEEFSEEEDNGEDLCVTKDEISQGDGGVKIGLDIEELWSMTEPEAIQEIKEIDRSFGPSSDLNVSENKGDFADNRLRCHEDATENLNQVTDPKPQLPSGGFSGEETELVKGQDIFATEQAFELQMVCDNKKGSVSNDEIIVAPNEQRVGCKIKSEKTVFEEKQEVVPDDGVNKTEYGRSSEIENNVFEPGMKKDTEEVIEKLTGWISICDREKHVDVEGHNIGGTSTSKEENAIYTEVGSTLTSMVEVVENNTEETRGGEKFPCEEPVADQEPKKHVACEGIREEILECNNGNDLQEYTVPEILEVEGEKLVNAALSPEHTERDNKEIIKYHETYLKSESSQLSELIEGREEAQTGEGIFEVEEVEAASETVIEDYTVTEDAKSLGDMERTESQLLSEPKTNILKDLEITEAESFKPSDIEVRLLEEETEISSSGETLRTETGLSREIEHVKVQCGEGWIEPNTARPTFECVKETHVQIPEVKTDLKPEEDSDETVAGLVKEPLETDPEVDTSVVRTQQELYTELLVEFASGNTLETQSWSLKEREAEMQSLRTTTVPSEKTVTAEANKVDALVGQESMFLTQSMDLLSNNSLETTDGLSDKPLKDGTELEGIEQTESSESESENSSDFIEKSAGKLEVTICEEFLQPKHIVAELLKGKVHLETIVTETETGTTNETDREKLGVRRETSASGDESGTVDTEAGILRESAVESELAEELSEAETGVQKDKEQMIELEPSEETNIKEFVESEVKDLVEMGVGSVETVELLPKEVWPKIDQAKGTCDVSSEVTVKTEAHFSEEVEPNSAETRSGSEDDLGQNIPNVRPDTVVSEETMEDKSRLSDSLSDESLDSEDDLQVKRNARCMADLNEPDTGLYMETERVESKSSERGTSEFGLNKEIVEFGLSDEPETDPGLLEKYPENQTTLQILPDAVLSTVSIDIESRLSETKDSDLSDESNGTEASSLKISVAGLFDKSVHCETGLQKTDKGISNVENGSGLSEETVDTGLAQKTHGTELLKNTEAELSYDSTKSEDQLVEKTEEDMTKTFLGIEVQVSSVTVVKEALETEDVVNTETEEDILKPTEGFVDTETEEDILKTTEDVVDTETQQDILKPREGVVDTETQEDILKLTEDVVDTETQEDKLKTTEDGVDTETQEDILKLTEDVVDTETQQDILKPTEDVVDTETQEEILKTTEDEAGEPEETEVGWLKTDAEVPEENRGDDVIEGTESVYRNITDQFDASALDFTAQKARIALKNPQVRPPSDPRTLLNMPSLTPSPPKPMVHLPVRGLMGIPTGGIGIKLPGLGVGFPVLRKTEKGVRDEKPVPQKSEIEPEVRDEERKPKWTPPRQPGFGNPLMMNELKNKLKKTTKEKEDD